MSCFVKDCKNIKRLSTDGSVTFHKFPVKDETRCKLWLSKINRTYEEFIKVKTRFICSKHFKKDDFREAAGSINKPLRLLQFNAVPFLSSETATTEIQSIKIESSLNEIKEKITTIPISEKKDGPIIVTLDELGQRCCTCIRNNGVIDIFRAKYKEILFCDLFEMLFSHQMNTLDVLPQTICTVCAKFLIDCYSFKEQIENSKKILDLLCKRDDTQSIDNTQKNYLKINCIKCKLRFETESDYINHYKIDKILKIPCSVWTTNLLVSKKIETSLDSKNEVNNFDEIINIIKKNSDDKQSSIDHTYFDKSNTSNELNVLKITDCEKSKAFNSDLCNTTFSSQSEHFDQHVPETNENPCIDTYGKSQNFAVKKCIYENKKIEEEKIIKPRKTTIKYQNRRKHQCPICGKMYISYMMRDHINSHYNQKSHMCDICGIKFSYSSNLHKHKLKHQGLLLCHVCGKRFTTHISLNFHTKTQHFGVKLYKCVFCSKSFGRQHDFVIHLQCHSDENQYKCKVCESSFNHLNRLTKHMIYAHSTEKSYFCKICLYGFAENKDLKNHLKRHEDENQLELVTKRCVLCNKLSRNIRVHMLSHTKDKLYICAICDKAFTQNCVLKSHMYRHLGGNNHRCDVCNKTFRLKQTLICHYRVHTGEKPYKCGECCKAFSQYNTLLCHKRFHTGEKPFECPYCPNAFSVKGNLKQHIRKHTGERPFKCNVCLKGFPSSSNLKKHQLIHNKNMDKAGSQLGGLY